MKKLLIVICCVFSLSLSAQSVAQEATTLVESESHNVFTGIFRSVWARLKAVNPSPRDSAKAKTVYTAGIRGAESTDTLLKPYWKGDLTQDPAFQNELQKFGLAQLNMDRGELDAAIASFDDFLAEFGQSDLRPNALFAKSISQAGLGRAEASLATMQLFVDEYPNHPLIADARRVIDELR